MKNFARRFFRLFSPAALCAALVCLLPSCGDDPDNPNGPDNPEIPSDEADYSGFTFENAGNYIEFDRLTGFYSGGYHIKYSDYFDLEYYKNILSSLKGRVFSRFDDSKIFNAGENYNLVIPSKYEGLPVVAIGSGVGGSENFTGKVTIPDSVVFIHECAFIAFPDVENNNGFKLTSIAIPGSVKAIGANAFEHNQLTSVTIPGSVKYIGGDIYGIYPAFAFMTKINRPTSSLI